MSYTTTTENNTTERDYWRSNRSGRKMRGGNNDNNQMELEKLSVLIQNLKANLQNYDDNMFNLIPFGIRGLLALLLYDRINNTNKNETEIMRDVNDLFQNNNVEYRNEYQAAIMGYVITSLQMKALVRQYRDLVNQN